MKKLDVDDVAPRIKSLREQRDALLKSRVLVEAELVAQDAEPVDGAAVKAYAEDLAQLLNEAEATERKAFLRSFVRRVEIEATEVTMRYVLPMPNDEGRRLETEALPTARSGGARVTKDRTFSIAFPIHF